MARRSSYSSISTHKHARFLSPLAYALFALLSIFSRLSSFRFNHDIQGTRLAVKRSNAVAITSTDTTRLFGTAAESLKTSNFETPLPKYPTKRGSTVDSRKIIPTNGDRNSTVSFRLAHILFATEEMAMSALRMLSSARETTFREMANQISLCATTRSAHGEIGWISSSHPQDDANNFGVENILPAVAQKEVFQKTTKPGDIVMVNSSKGVHLVQIVDIKQSDVSKMMSIRKPRKRQQRLSSLDLYTSQKQRYYKIETMGCQMNLADSERMEGQLKNMGIIPFCDNNNVDDEQPDIVVLNTCSIRDHAEQKVYSYLGPYAKRKREHSQDDLIIVVAGCVAQQEGETLLRRVPEIDLVVGPQYANRISDLLEDVIINKNQVVATEATHIMEDYTKPKRSSALTAWVNVIYGCNERCTYCIVPTTRGVEQSRPIEAIVEEVKGLVADGYKGTSFVSLYVLLLLTPTFFL